MLAEQEYNYLLQMYSEIFLPNIELLKEVKVFYKGKEKSYKGKNIFKAYDFITALPDYEKYELKFEFKDNHIKDQVENFTFDILYS